MSIAMKQFHYSTNPKGNFKLVNGIDVRVNNVDNTEIGQLTTLIDALNNHLFEEYVINSGNGAKDFIVTVKNCELKPLKDALRTVLSVVKPERVLIEP